MFRSQQQAKKRAYNREASRRRRARDTLAKKELQKLQAQIRGQETLRSPQPGSYSQSLSRGQSPTESQSPGWLADQVRYRNLQEQVEVLQAEYEGLEWRLDKVREQRNNLQLEVDRVDDELHSLKRRDRKLERRLSSKY